MLGSCRPRNHSHSRAAWSRNARGSDAIDARVQDRGEHAIERRPRRDGGRAGHEPLDLVDDGVLIADKRQVILARQLDEPRAGNAAGDVAAFLDLQH